MINVIAYHTCRKNSTAGNAPFLSRRNNQWLTQGYYFWTDSDYFAHKWGESHYKKKDDDYCIMKFNLSFEKGELLDLVGNVQHKIDFFKCYEKIMKKQKSKVSLAEVVQYMRDFENRIPGAFSYKAIKSEDKRELDLIDIPVAKDASEKISMGPTRQQLCVFENCYNFSKGVPCE
ncbi:hypothetical protein [uncultured Gammaproteobacteria bacterium]|nr:hypothetical protein [uncultured Gammaproteobacteria bacterium]